MCYFTSVRNRTDRITVITKITIAKIYPIKI